MRAAIEEAAGRAVAEMAGVAQAGQPIGGSKLGELRVAQRQLPLQPLAMNRIAECTNQKAGSHPALDQVILRALGHGDDRRLLVIQAAEHDDRQVGGPRLKGPKRLQPAAVGQPQIEQDHFEVTAVDRAQGVRQPANLGDDKPTWPCLPQRLLDQQRVGGAVLYQKNLNGLLVMIHLISRSAV